MVVVRGEECDAAFRNGEVKIIFSEVVLKGGKVLIGVGFHGGDVCASGYDVDVVGVLNMCLPPSLVLYDGLRGWGRNC